MSHLNGVAQAYTFANAKITVDGYPEMFCTRSISLTGELAAEAIRIAADALGDDGHPAVLVMYGFEEMFPCR